MDRILTDDRMMIEAECCVDCDFWKDQCETHDEKRSDCVFRKSLITKTRPVCKAQDSKTAKIVRTDDLDEFLKKLNELIVLRSEIKPNGDVMIKGGAIYELIKEYTLEKAKLKQGILPSKLVNECGCSGDCTCEEK
jgi:hypothetical protein